MQLGWRNTPSAFVGVRKTTNPKGQCLVFWTGHDKFKGHNHRCVSHVSEQSGELSQTEEKVEAKLR